MLPSISLGVLFAATSVFALHESPRTQHRPRQLQPVGDCSSEAIAAGAGVCQQICPVNEIPQYDGTCACDFPKLHLVKHGSVGKTICQPRCDPGYTLTSNFTTCVCAPTSYFSHNTGKCWETCPAGTYPLDSKLANTSGSCPSCHTIGVATCTGVGPGLALTCKPDKYGHPYFFDSTTSSCVTWGKCSPGTYPNLDVQPAVCSPCGNHVATCRDTSTALSCVPPYYLVNSQCVSECPSDMNPIIGSNGFYSCRYRRYTGVIWQGGENYYRLGCFIQSSETESLLTDSLNAPGSLVSPSKCISICREEGYQFCGLTAGGDCYGGRNAGIDWQLLNYSKDCTQVCEAQPRYTCGGSAAVEMYEQGGQQR